MTVKIISKPVKNCSLIVFPMCLKIEISLVLVEFFPEQISLVLIIPKLSRRAALTIANAAQTLCAERETALTSFALFQFRKGSGAGARRFQPANPA